MLAQEHATQAAAAAQAGGPAGHEAAGHAAAQGFNAGETIIDHVSNSSLEHPLIHLPTIAGIDLSVTKHVFMLWLVAGVGLRDRHERRPALPGVRTGRCRPAS